MKKMFLNLTTLAVLVSTFSTSCKKKEDAPVPSTVPTVTTTNQSPVVSITAPAQNSSFNSGTSVTISANATDADGTISKVEFYDGSTLLNTDTESPYSFTTSSLTAGSHTITAKAYDNASTTTTSAAISITITTVVVAGPTEVTETPKVIAK